MKFNFLHLRIQQLLLILGITMLGVYSTYAQGQKPNILFIMVDDLGAEALGSYGNNNFKTPHLDKLANSGIRFENCYALPVCVPSRMQLMTGRYPFRTGWKYNSWGPNWSYNTKEERSFAELLQSAGYATCIVDKWMLSYDFEDQPNIFKEAGFDEHYMWRLWDSSIPVEQRVAKNNPITSGYWDASLWKNGPVDDGAGKYGPDLFCNYLIDFMKRNQNRPFLAYWPMHLVHNETFHGKTTPPTPESLSSNPDKTGKRIDHQEGMAEMIFYMDKLVGRLVATLDSLGLRENTLIIFTGDNGTTPGIKSHWGQTEIPGGKGKLNEVGCRVPLIANWKGISPEGIVQEDLIDFSDFLPTFAQLAGAKLPNNKIVDGQSFLPQLKGLQGEPRKWVYCELDDNWFIRTKDWSLYKNGDFFNVSERYNPIIAVESTQSDKMKKFLASEVSKLHMSEK